MTKPGVTPESRMKDRAECEQAAAPAQALNAYAIYRDCMRARGYR